MASYALYENSTVRSAHENSDKANFNLAVRAAVNSYYTLLISGQERSDYYVEQLAPLYDKFQQDNAFREEVFSAVAESVDKLLIELERVRTKAEELGIPFSDRFYDPDESDNPYAYDSSMSLEDSRKAADANNLDEFMSGYSDELKMAAASYNADEFRRYFADRAAKALESNAEHYLDSLRSDRDYLNSVCDLVSPSVYNELREDIQQEKRAANSINADIQISGADIEKLRSIEPRKSVLNFTDEEITATAAFADTFQADIGNKSPFFRAKTGDWRDREQTTIPVIKVEDRNADFKSVRNDIKSRVILRGSAGNEDTGWDIQISRVGLEDTVNYGQKFKDKAVFNALYHIEEIVRSGVLLDTVTSERNNNNKALNTEFMHKLYGVFDFNGERYLAKLSIEEFPDANLNPLRRMYNLQDIKIEPLKRIGFEDKSLAHSVFNDSKISIAQLFQIVKSFDKDFYVNKSKSLAEIRATYSTNSAEREAEPEMQTQSGDFRITDETVLGEGGLKTKYQNNIAAITTAVQRPRSSRYSQNMRAGAVCRRYSTGLTSNGARNTGSCAGCSPTTNTRQRRKAP